MLSRLFSGADGETGRGHAVTAVGDPNQAIYGWRGASVSNILRLRRGLPGPDGGDGPDVLADGQPPLRHAASSTSPTASPQPLLRRASDRCRPLEPGRDGPRGRSQVAVHETYADELAWLAEHVREARTSPTAAGARSASWPATTPTRPTSSTH